MRSHRLRREHDPMTSWPNPHRRDRLAEICGQYLGKGQLLALEGPLQTRRWEDDRKVKHHRTEVVASSVEMLSGRRKKDYAAYTAAKALETQAEVLGIDPVDAQDFDADGPAVDLEAEKGVPVAS